MGRKVVHDFDSIIGEVDVVNMLRVQFERIKSSQFPTVREFTSLFGLTSDRFQRCKKDVFVMHPGPMNRGIEIQSNIADGPQSGILTQVTNGLAVRMAVLVSGDAGRMTQRSRRSQRAQRKMPYENEISPYASLADVPEEINELAHRVIGICIAIHRELGPGLPEEAYEKALAMDFEAAGIRFERQYPLQVLYKGVCVARVRLDFLVESKLVLEIKSCECFTPIDRKQVLRYLQVTKLPLGLLVNFNVMVLKEGIKRVIRSEPIP